LWDDLEVIVPDEHFPVTPIIGPHQQEQANIINEAFEIVVRPRSLEDAEKELLHKKIEQLVSGGIPAALRFKPRVDNYNMFPEKLSQKTWDLLISAELASDRRHGYYDLQRDFGLIMMGMIADLCAGGTRIKVTNYTDAHEAYTRLTAAQAGGEEEFRAPVEQEYAKLVSISARCINGREFPLKKLVELRKREREDGFLPILRQNYRTAVDAYIEKLRTEARTARDVKQIETEFEKAIRDDFKHLRKMMELEVGIPILTAAFAFLCAIAGQPIAAIGVIAVGIPTFRLKRQQTLEKHTTGWLYTQ
jgi:hypothetical protein